MPEPELAVRPAAPVPRADRIGSAAVDGAASPPSARPGEVTRPVARVAVDVSLQHLDRPFDYAVPDSQDAEAQPGARVRVRFAGKLRDGFILERLQTSQHVGELAALHKVISAEPVLTAETARLVRRVADHYGGSFADVMRLAVPPRHAATEKAVPASRASDVLAREVPLVNPLAAYPTGVQLLEALRAGHRPRAAWQVVPSAEASGDWAAGLALAARATLLGGRGSVLVVPDARDLERLRLACVAALGEPAFVVLTAELGPAARYRAFLAALRGQVRVVIGTRAAAFAPVHDLGLVALLDDGDDLLSEPRAPYPHAREVLALRATDARTAALFAGYGRTAEIQQWVDRGWLRELAADPGRLRHAAPRLKVTADSDQSLARDPMAKAARVPHEVFELMRAALPQGPVLVQVPRAGYLMALVCQDCREPARCTSCEGPVQLTHGPAGRPSTHESSDQPAGPHPGQDAGRGEHPPPDAPEHRPPDRSKPAAAAPSAPGVPAAPRASAAGTPSCTWCGRRQLDWACRICGGTTLRAPVVGAERTAEELGKAFPHTVVRQSRGGTVLDTVPSTPAIVVATPGAEPQAEGGYAGAVLLDTGLLLLRADLRASEEALRRWLNAVALVRGGEEGGSVIAAGESSSRALQALVRLDPAGLARRELAERAEAHFPPAVKMVLVEGRSEALTEFTELARLPPHTDTLGPVELAPQPHSELVLHRLTLRAPLAEGAALVRAVRDVAAIRSARKSEGALRVRVDPVAVT